jgi:hypothetical protein
MTRLRLTLRIALLGVVVALPVSADAPTGGADQQYENFDSGNKVIEDRFTRLVWDRPSEPYPAVMNFAAASTYCKGAKRLPSLKELLTIVDEEPRLDYDIERQRNVLRYIDEAAFPKTPAEGFWSSSLKNASEAWTVDFGTGETKTANMGDARRVRCVEEVGP